MSMNEWAKNEVELAKIANSKDGDELDGYVCACYDSALKAFNSLCEDGHSGMSISITKDILVRLIDGKPLTPIEDNEDAWSSVPERHRDGTLVYQCKRMSSLFKHINPDGSVNYHDVDRVLCKDIKTAETFHGGFESRWYDETHPITFPYYPYSEPIMIYVEEFLYDPKNRCFDTPTALLRKAKAYLTELQFDKMTIEVNALDLHYINPDIDATIKISYVVNPDGSREEVYKYFAETGSGFVEIPKEEYEEKYSVYMDYMERLLSNEEEKANGKA